MIKKHDNFIFFSAGPVGDHVLLIDVANHFYKATGITSVFILKNPFPFLNYLYLPYKKNIRQIFFVGVGGFFRMILLSIQSIYQKNVFVLFFPIPLPRYLKLYIFFIKNFTRSRIIGMNLEGSKSFPAGKGYASYLGKENTIEMLAEPFTASANRMLGLLGYESIKWTPTLQYTEEIATLSKLGIVKGKYIVMHLPASHTLRSLPEDRWNEIIKHVTKKLHGVKVIFTGAKGDLEFIESCLDEVEKSAYELALGLGAQELLTLYANAHMAVTVQTGNGLIINMLHIPTVIVNIKGTTMFDYTFNTNAVNLFSKKDCICNPFETSCNMILYNGKEYMACLFNIPNDEIIKAILSKCTK